MGLLDPWRTTRQNIIDNRPAYQPSSIYQPMFPAQDYSGMAYRPSNTEPVGVNEATLDPNNPYIPRRKEPVNFWTENDINQGQRPEENPINLEEAEGHAQWAESKNMRGLMSLLDPTHTLGLANAAANMHAASKAEDVFGSYLDPDLIDRVGGLSMERVSDMIGSEWGGRGGQVFDPTTGGWNFAGQVEKNIENPGLNLAPLNPYQSLQDISPFGTLAGSAPMKPSEYIDPEDTYYDHLRDNEGNFKLADAVRLGLERVGDNWWDYAKGGRFHYGDYGHGWNPDGSSKTQGQAEGTSPAWDDAGTSGLLNSYFGAENMTSDEYINSPQQARDIRTAQEYADADIGQGGDMDADGPGGEDWSGYDDWDY
tara:strand:- start:270 stop:1373 length:1104 start_codon:yes stop_codon:yes gene_type:complete